MPAVGAAVGQFGRDDDVRRVIDRQLAVVAVIEAAAGALHDAAFRVGEVLLRFRLGFAELVFEARFLGGLFAAARWWVLVVGAATARGIGRALARLEPRARRLDDGEPILASRDFGRDVEIGFAALGMVGRLGLGQQRINLRLQFQLRLVHALIAHRFVA